MTNIDEEYQNDTTAYNEPECVCANVLSNSVTSILYLAGISLVVIGLMLPLALINS